MANTKLVADGTSLTVLWGSSSAFVTATKPTVAELAACLDITESISFDGYGFGTQASNQNAQPSFKDVGNAQTRGYAQFGGAIPLFYPSTYVVSSTDPNYLTFAALLAPWTTGYLIVRIDGRKTTSSLPDVNKAIVANDFIQVYKVESDGYDDTVEGENAFTYSITFLSQATIYANAVAATSVTVSTPVAVGSAAYTVGGKTPLTATKNSRTLHSTASIYIGTPGFFTWSSSNTAHATVDSNGVVTGVAAGAATIVATDKITGTASTGLAITVA